MSTIHEAFRRDLAAFLAGMLSPQDERRLEAHAAECAPCRGLLELGRGALPDWAAAAEHVPTAALVAFAEHAAELLPLERELVAGHVARCEECRADLAELRGASAAALTAIPAAEPGRSAPARAAATGFPGRGRDLLIGGLVGALAAAAAFVFVVRPPQRAVAPGDVLTRPAPVAPAPAAAPPRASAPPGAGASLGALLPTRTLAAVLRGAGAETLRVEIPAGGGLLPLRLPALFVEPSTRLELSLAGPDGRVLARQVVRYREILPPRSLVVDLGDAMAGVYELRVATVGSEGKSPRVYYLEVLPAGR